MTIEVTPAAPSVEESDTADVRPVPWTAFGGVAVLGLAAGVWATRDFYLWLDDFVFIGEAKRTPFGLDYLTEGLYQHFSPISRLVDAAAWQVLPDHTWVARGFMLLLLAVHVGAVLLVSVVLLGRTTIGLLAAAALATSLAMLPLVNWWTAGLNILPSVTGTALCLAGAVALARGGSRWWGLLAVVGYTVGVLDYETGMLAPAYALAWVLLFPGAEGRLPLPTLWRRTAWLWLALGVVGAAALVNYRLNYYVDTPGAPLGQYAEALARALFQVQLPLLLGFSDLDNRLFTWCGVAVAVVAVAALLVRAWRRPAAWKGLGFALAGFLLPIAALVLNRVGVVGQVIVTLPYYYALSSLLMVLGIAAALAEPEPAGARDRAGVRAGHRARGRVPVVPTVLVVVVVLAWAHSVGPTSRLVFVAGHRLFPDEPVNTPTYITALSSSARDVARRDPDATLLDGDVPDSVVWDQYAPYNRLNVVAPLLGIRFPIDDPDGSPYVATPRGRLVPVDLVWRQRLDVRDGVEPGLQLPPVVTPSADGACFEATSTSGVEWILPRPLRGDHLVLRAEVTVDRATPYRVYTAEGAGDYVEANNDGKAWDPSGDTWLDTISALRVDKLVINQLDPGTHVCVRSLSVGQAVAP